MVTGYQNFFTNRILAKISETPKCTTCYNPAMKQSLTLLSYNVFGAPFHGQKIIATLLRTKVRRRFRLIAKEITKKNFDFLLFQEVHTYPHLFVLKRALPKEYKVYFQLGIYGPKGGMVTFTKRKISKKLFVDFFDKGVLWNRSITGPLTQKGMLLLKIKDTQTWVINTHLTQNSSGVWGNKSVYTKILTSQLRQCAASLKSLQKKGYSIVVGGDFNMPHTSELYTKFVTESDMKDVFEKSTTSTYLQWFEGEKKSERIDYIFYTLNPSLILEKKENIFTQALKNERGEKQLLSDHVGLFATFSTKA